LICDARGARLEQYFDKRLAELESRLNLDRRLAELEGRLTSAIKASGNGGWGGPGK
jgi:uncharacterized coiled-coil protein SlyX